MRLSEMVRAESAAEAAEASWPGPSIEAKLRRGRASTAREQSGRAGEGGLEPSPTDGCCVPRLDTNTEAVSIQERMTTYQSSAPTPVIHTPSTPARSAPLPPSRKSYHPADFSALQLAHAVLLRQLPIAVSGGMCPPLTLREAELVTGG